MDVIRDLFGEYDRVYKQFRSTELGMPETSAHVIAWAELHAAQEAAVVCLSNEFVNHVLARAGSTDYDEDVIITALERLRSLMVDAGVATCEDKGVQQFVAISGELRWAHSFSGAVMLEWLRTCHAAESKRLHVWGIKRRAFQVNCLWSYIDRSRRELLNRYLAGDPIKKWGAQVMERRPRPF